MFHTDSTLVYERVYPVCCLLPYPEMSLLTVKWHEETRCKISRTVAMRISNLKL